MVLVVGLGLSAAAAARAQPETRGTHALAEWDAGRVSAAGAMIRTRVVYPTDLASPGPIVIVMHGYLRNGSYHMELARDLASRGMIAVVPDMPCGLGGCDHDANARQLTALFAWAIGESARSGSRIAGTIDPERRGLVGHSWGGLGTFLTASRDAAVDVWVGLDPQEDRGAALAAASDVRIPNAHLMAEVDGSCNGDWGADVYAATAAPHLRMVIADSGHCDPEEPTDAACDFACAAGDRATMPLFRRYTVAFVACVLGVDASMREWVGGSGFDADVAAGRLVSVMESGIDGIDCSGGGSITPVDGGVGADAGGGADASAAGDAGGVGEDAAVARDAGGGGSLDASASADAGSSGGGESGGCGCRAAGRAPVCSGRGLATIGLAALALAAIAARRARRRSSGAASAAKRG